MDFDLDPTDPLGFFLWDEFIDPGKYQCDNCGSLFDDEWTEWSEERQCDLFQCPSCGVRGEISGPPETEP
jgi:DNA-directed RNA polymerase subunit RPC12/RpoP